MALLAPGVAGAATLAVPDDYDTITEAIDAASSGDTITVASGAWDEKLSIDKDLHLVGAGSNSTVLTTANGPLIGVSSADVSVSGFTLIATIRGRGMVVSGGATVDIDDLVMGPVPGNQDGGALIVSGAGTEVALGASRLSATLEAPRRGGLILVEDGATLTATDTALEDGSAQDGGAIWAEDSTVSLHRCTLSGNRAETDGGAVHISGGSLLVEDCALTHNSAALRGGAMFVDGADEVQVTGSLVCANTAVDNPGGGAWVSGVGGTHVWRNNAFVENTADEEGGAIYAEITTLTVTNNHFLTQSASTGGALSLRDADVDFVNNLVAWTGMGDGLTAVGAGTFYLAWGGWWSNTGADVSGDLSASDLDSTHIFEDPELVDYSPDGDCTNDDLAPGPTSPLVDAGDPLLLDEDGSRSDIGAFGGEGNDLLTDADGDGWSALFDCDDDDPSVNPGAQEVCDPDDVDEDCDDQADDADPSVTGTASWCPDADGDGFGDQFAVAAWCDPPSGHVAECTDCDDSLAAVHPGAVEVCDGTDVDEDCDGLVDGDDPDVIELRLFPDLDGDGYGDMHHDGLETCEPPWLASADDTDCDDADPDTYPGAAEIYGDGLDQDCTGHDAEIDWGGGGGCAGCASGAPGVGWLVLLAAFGVRRRRH